MKLKVILLAVIVGFTASCAKMVEDAIKKNPEVVFKAIEANPKAFFDTVQKAQMEAQKLARENAEKDQEKQLEDEFKNPKKPSLDSKRASFGPADAKVTIVEYSDFQCPFCARAANTMDEVMKKYGKDVRLIYKHLPFKPNAEPAARYYEAIAIQDAGKAKKFHDILYANQKKIYEGEAYLKSVVKEVGADQGQIDKTKDSAEVTRRINEDRAEAEKFQISGTPGFIVNGVTVKGAYPLDHFVKIIDRHLKK